MPKLPEPVATYIAGQPEDMRPALLELHGMFAMAYPHARIELFGTAKGALPVYKDGDTLLGGFSARRRGPMVYLTDPAVVAKHKQQLGSLAPPGNGACVLYKPTRNLDGAALRQLVRTMIEEVAAGRRKG